MNDNLRLVIDGYDVVLEDDTNITINKRNPYLNDGIESYSYQFDLPIKQNLQLFGPIAHVDDDTRVFSIEGKSAQLYIKGLLMFDGKVAPIEEQEIKDKLSISLVSNKKQLKDLFGDIKLQDITTPVEDQDDLQIGEMIGNLQVDMSSTSSYNVKVRYSFIFGDFSEAAWLEDVYPIDVKPADNRSVQLNALGFSTNKEYDCSPTWPFNLTDGKLIVNKDFINTSVPFGDTIIQPDGTTRRALYHNARISYLHYRKGEDGKSTSDVLYNSDLYGPYYVLPADRPQSGICFYLLYVLEAIFKYIGVAYDDSELRKVDDMRHLSFFTTKCTYDLVDKYENDYDGDPKKDSTKLYHGDFKLSDNFNTNGINTWLNRRKTGGSLSVGDSRTDNAKKWATIKLYNKYYYHDGRNLPLGFKKLADFEANGNYYGILCVREDEKQHTVTVYSGQDIDIVLYDTIKDVPVHGSTAEVKNHISINEIDLSEVKVNYKYGGSVMKMIANFDCLPEMSINDFLDSLWASFGIKFDFYSERNFVKASFIRDILGSTYPPEKMACDVIEQHKVSERITGVRMKYNNESDRNDQLANLRKKVTDYDTDYDYIVDLSQRIVTDKDYVGITRRTLSAGDRACYIDMNTGNAYRVKINKDALSNSSGADDAVSVNSLAPVVFQVATYKGITIYIPELQGYSEDELQLDSDVEDSIHELISNFVPLVQNDINFGKPESVGTLLCPYADVEMWNEDVTMDTLRYIFDSTDAYCYYIDAKFTTDECYDVSQSDDGSSPLQSIDWGNCITLMRGGGADARIEYFDYDYDGFGNAKYRISGGQYQMDSDSITLKGEEYDYNGDLPGIGGLIINGSYNGEYTKDQAAALMREIWPSSNANLTSEFRQVTSEQMREQGWDVEGDAVCTVFSQTHSLRDKDGIIKEYLVTPITDEGNILTPDELNEYLSSIEKRAAQGINGIMAIDAMRYGVGGAKPGRHIIIQEFKDGVSEGNNNHSPYSDFYAEVLHQLQAIYFLGATTVNATPPPGLIIEHNIKFGPQERISLKIRAYHKDAEGNILCSTQHANRGLADRFMAEYIYFLLHRKKERFKLRCPEQYLIEPQWLKRYAIDNVTGWPDDMQIVASVKNGIESVQLDLYVL